LIPKFALAEQKYRRSEKSGSGRNCSLHFFWLGQGIAKIQFISQSSTALPEAKTDSLFDQAEPVNYSPLQTCVIA
jgi:hypothetical protein